MGKKKTLPFESAVQMSTKHFHVKIEAFAHTESSRLWAKLFPVRFLVSMCTRARLLLGGALSVRGSGIHTGRGDNTQCGSCPHLWQTIMKNLN